MKSEERIKLQRDWIYAMSLRLELEVDGDESSQLSHDFAVMAGALDWVLTEDLTEEAEEVAGKD